MKTNLKDRINVNGYLFEYVPEQEYYECRGELMYDDEHDQMPEPGLWKAAAKLVEILKAEGHDSHRSHSEKGWVEVVILNPK